MRLPLRFPTPCVWGSLSFATAPEGSTQVAHSGPTTSAQDWGQLKQPPRFPGFPGGSPASISCYLGPTYKRAPPAQADLVQSSMKATVSRIQYSTLQRAILYLAALVGAVLLGSCLGCGATPDCIPNPHWGTFSDPDGPDAKFQSDGRTCVLSQDFVYLDPNQESWTAPQGLRWDGASIPAAAWSIIGSPFVGCHRNASAVHDYYYKHHSSHQRSRREVDTMYYEACRAAGMEWTSAMTQFYALRWFGARWDPDDIPLAAEEHSALDVPAQQELLERYSALLRQVDELIGQGYDSLELTEHLSEEFPELPRLHFEDPFAMGGSLRGARLLRRAQPLLQPDNIRPSALSERFQ